MSFIWSGDLWIISTSLEQIYRSYGLYKVGHTLDNIDQTF
jgi:hypothetical protein